MDLIRMDEIMDDEFVIRFDILDILGRNCNAAEIIELTLGDVLNRAQQHPFVQDAAAGRCLIRIPLSMVH